jgi:hypothetical protein
VTRCREKSAEAVGTDHREKILIKRSEVFPVRHLASDESLVSQHKFKLGFDFASAIIHLAIFQGYRVRTRHFVRIPVAATQLVVLV